MSKTNANNTGELVAISAERSRSSSSRPRLSSEVEARLDEIERKSAACYAELELATYRLRKLATKIDDNDGIAVGNDGEDDSGPMKNHLHALQAAAGEKLDNPKE